MTILLKALLLNVLPIMLYGCVDNTDSDYPALSLEAWIDSDGYPVALLTQSLRPGTDDLDVRETMVRWGTVRITDGTDTVMMTGGMDYTVFPPFSYRGFKMKGEVGRTYTVIADYKGRRITATSRILEPARIDSIEFTPAGDSGEMRSGRILFTPAQCADTSRYVVFTRVRNRETRHYPGLLGAVSVAPGADKATAPLYRGANVLEAFEPNFVVGDTLDVILARVDDCVFDFWQGYNEAVYFGNNVFVSTGSSPRGNVVGGYGVFSARGVSRRMLIVE